MAIQKQSIPINFGQGVDLKTDPWQVQAGKFLQLRNSVFNKGGQLQKRNGYGPLAQLPTDDATKLTTFNNNLTAIGPTLYAYSSPQRSWTAKGAFQPLTLDVLPTVRSAVSQTQCDAVTSASGLICTVYTENNNGTNTYKYTIQDAATSQNIINPTVIPVVSGTVTGSPRVFLLGGYFIIVFTNVITAVSHLQYIAISIADPTIVTAAADIVSTYTPSSTVAWDGVVVGTKLFIAYNTVAGGQQVKVTYLNTSFIVAAPASFAGSIATNVSMCVDNTNPASPVIYSAFYDSASQVGAAIAVDQNLNTIMTATQYVSGTLVRNVTCTAQNGILTIIYSVNNNYAYDSAIPTYYLNRVAITKPATVTTGTVGSTTTIVRSVGLASKAFLYNSVMYVLAAYQSSLQSTYFLINSSGQVISRFAYQNGGGYLATGLPYAQVIDNVVSIPYLYKSLIESTNTLNLAQSIGPAGASNIYAQTGINQISISFSANTLSVSEMGNNLNISGGMLWAYDGQLLGEQGFHLYPDNVETTLGTDLVPTGTLSNVTNPTRITAMSSTVGIVPGMIVTDTTNPTTIPAGTTVVSVDSGTQITMSAAATAAHVGDTLKFAGGQSAQQYYYMAVYECTDAQGNIIESAPSIPVSVIATAGHTFTTVNVPTIRLTYKVNTKISIYRWSAAQQTYYKITSIAAPLLNSTTVDYVSFVDVYSDAQIIGNKIIYTTGGVLENIAGPASTATTLFDNRLWLIDAEDKNLLWYSKEIIESTPVEMSDLLTRYIAPSTGAQGSSGDLQCLFPLDDKLIMFKNNAIYYLNGVGPDNTGANNQYSQPIFITGTVGCPNQSSIVLTPDGLMFQSNKGIWLLARNLQTMYIGADVEEFNAATVNSAVTVPGTTEVRFTLDTGTTLMYDYYYKQWGTFVNVPAISSTLYNSLHTYVNDVGQIYQETPGLYLDNGNAVLLNFKTSWFNLAGLQGYQRAFFFYLLGQYKSPHKLVLSIAYDYNPAPAQQTIITPNNPSPNYGTEDIGPYGYQDTYGGPGDVEQWRVFLAQQRCQSFQIQLQEQYDPSYGVQAGLGLLISGLNLVIGIKKGFKTIGSSRSAGGGTNRG